MKYLESYWLALAARKLTLVAKQKRATKNYKESNDLCCYQASKVTFWKRSSKDFSRHPFVVTKTGYVVSKLTKKSKAKFLEYHEID